MNVIEIKGPRSSSDSNLSAMRFHELGVQFWLNKLFQIQNGYPVPVVFAPVMDAYSQFSNLWKAPNNPFAYLLDLKDPDGRPLYEPYPSNIRYPLLSVQRKDWTFRSSQNYTLHPARIYGWTTDKDNPERNDLAYVIQRQRPMAWDFKFQVDFLCLRPDVQALFIEKAMGEFWRTGGPEPQSWMEVPYPQWFGTRYIRVRLLGGSIVNMTADAPLEGHITEFRTTFTIVVEGYKLDSDFDLVPAFWKLQLNSILPMNPTDLAWIFGGSTIDLRDQADNAVLDSRTPLPPKNELTIIPTKTIAYDDFSSYAMGVISTKNPQNAGMFFSESNSYSFESDVAIVDYHGSKALSMLTGSLTRKLDIGSFSSVRVAILFTIDSNVSVTGFKLGLGLVDSSGSSLGGSPKLFAGSILGDLSISQTATCANDIDPPVLVLNGSIPYVAYLAWNAGSNDEETPTSNTPYVVPISGLARRVALVVDVTITNSHTFAIQTWFADIDQARIDLSVSDFIGLIQQSGSLAINGLSLQNGGSVSISSGIQYGTLDAINVYWSSSNAKAILLHSMAAVKLS